jgi:YD repeat-containing protein
VGALAWGYVGRRRSSEPYGKTTAFTYDAAGNLTEVKTPGGSRVTMAYDAGGRMTSRVDPRGNVAGAAARIPSPPSGSPEAGGGRPPV